MPFVVVKWVKLAHVELQLEGFVTVWNRPSDVKVACSISVRTFRINISLESYFVGGLLQRKRLKLIWNPCNFEVNLFASNRNGYIFFSRNAENLQVYKTHFLSCVLYF